MVEAMQRHFPLWPQRQLDAVRSASSAIGPICTAKTQALQRQGFQKDAVRGTIPPYSAACPMTGR